jgi:hypothetical protein
MVDKKETGQAGKAPFVSGSDRPEVRLKSDTRLSDLTVRDLATVLGQLGTRKDFWDGKDWQKDDFDGPKPWKEDKEFKEFKEFKEKEKEFKEWKEKEKREIKEVKHEKLEKLEKIESDGVFEANPLADPRIEQVIRAVSGLSAKVDQLADQVEELKKRKG